MNEIETARDLEAALAHGSPLSGLRLQDLDLTRHEERLLTRTDLEGLVVLGGRLSPTLDNHLRLHGALVFPTDPHAPVNPYRASLYQPHELYAGMENNGYEQTPDALAYHWSRDADAHHDVFITLLRAIHDDSVSDALTEFVGGAPVVGVMGGHALTRDSEAYAGAARLGHTFASAGLVVATGGGPGAMEAANLGALCPTDAVVSEALGRLAGIPSFRPSIEDWARRALEIFDDIIAIPVQDSAVRSIGIPTWFYGHEPPNVFCNGIAKYFSNAVREDGLLARSTAGLVVLHGAAGTVQEIFQSITPLYYAEADQTLAPLVLVGVDHWSREVPVWNTIEALGRERGMGEAVHLVDTIDEAAELVLSSRT
ncbi:Rossmann fold nucleotide-binding protein [Knoellia sp. S7-12]|uniref:LOG family protein n=1 Tax=Knoellia sp. S7-12 TaxID=3126698 RepID=UPI0033674694